MCLEERVNESVQERVEEWKILHKVVGTLLELQPHCGGGVCMHK